MEYQQPRSDWHSKIAGEIELHKSRLNQKEQKRYKLALLLRVAGRVDQFSPTCGKCQIFQQDITQLPRDLWDIALMPEGWHRGYSRKIGNITKHLQKDHKLVTQGQYVGMWGGIGMAIGFGINAAADFEGQGLAIGVAIGVAVGFALDKKAKKEGRVI